MSSILKALKKLEEEKTAHRPNFLNLDTEILRDGSPRRFSTLTKTLLAVLLFVCGSGATYLFMKHESTTATLKQSTMALVDHPSTTVLPIVPLGATAEALHPSPPGTGKAPPLPIRADKSPAKHQAAQTLKLKHETKVSGDKPETMIIHPISDMNPILTVNGIAFQPEEADSVAIVNGVSVTRGSLIEGATVEDIQKDRVRFSFKKESIEVPLGRSNK